MKLEQPKVEKEIKYFFEAEEYTYTAEIIFSFDNDTGLKNDGIWSFKQCNYNVNSGTYFLEAWEFLSELYKKIVELNKELNK